MGMGMQAAGRLSRESYLVGASGGGIAAASYVAGLTPEHLLDIVKRLSHHTRKHGLWWKVRDPLAAAFQVSRVASCGLLGKRGVA
jgi:predicted acylesterase/phospholipase RssA